MTSAVINHFSITDFEYDPTTKLPSSMTGTSAFSSGAQIVARGDNLYIVNPNATKTGVVIYKLDGTTTDNVYTGYIVAYVSSPNPGGITGTFGVQAVGLANDDATLYIMPGCNPGVTTNFYTYNVNTTTWTTYTASSISQTKLPKGQILFDTDGTPYVCDYNVRSILKVNISGSSFSTSAIVSGSPPWCSYANFWTDNLGSRYIIFNSYNGSGSGICYVPFDGSTHSTTFFDVSGLTGLPSFSAEFPMCINQDTNQLFVVWSRVVYQLTISGNSSSLPLTLSFDSSNTLSIPSHDSSSNGDMICMTSNDTGGDLVGNIRIFASNWTGGATNVPTDIYKIYNSNPTGSGYGIQGVSVGGDPHITTLTGKSFIITPEDAFVYIDSLPQSKSLHPHRLYSWCDSFTIKHNRDLVSEYQYRCVDTNESFLKNIYFYIGKTFLQIDMTTLDLVVEEKDTSSITYILSDKVDCRYIPLAEYPTIKNKQYRQDLIFFRRLYFIIPSFVYDETVIEESKLTIEFIRTKCINYSDITLTFEGRNPMEYDGVIIEGEVKSPIIFDGEN